MSNTLFNRHTGLALVCPLTNTDRHYPFHVAVLDPLRQPPYRTLPVHFDDGSPSGVVPGEWKFWAKRPRATGRLRVSAGGRPIESGQALTLPALGSLQLEVALIGANGSERGVTRDPKTLYAVGPLWTLSVDETGRVTARPTSGFENQPLPAVRGVATVVYRDEARDLLAYSDVKIDIGEAP